MTAGGSLSSAREVQRDGEAEPAAKGGPKKNPPSGGFSIHRYAVWSEHVDEQEQRQPYRVDNIPIPGNRFEAEVLLHLGVFVEMKPEKPAAVQHSATKTDQRRIAVAYL